MMQVEGGVMSITDEAGRPPVGVGVAVAERPRGCTRASPVSPCCSAVSSRTPAARVSTSRCLILSSAGSPTRLRDVPSGGAPDRLGSRHPTIAPYQAYEATDGYVVAACASEPIWYRFCEALSQPDLVNDPRFETNERRVENRTQLETSSRTRSRTPLSRRWWNCFGQTTCRSAVSGTYSKRSRTRKSMFEEWCSGFLIHCGRDSAPGVANAVR